MATRKTANRALLRQRTASLYDAASERAYRIAQEIVEEIARQAPRRQSKYERANDTATPLHLSYYVERQPNGDSVIKCKKRYWVFVEYGTEEHGSAQRHVRPAVDIVRARHA